MFRKSIALLLGLNTLVSPALSLAATIPGLPGSVPLPTLPANALPVASGTSWQGVQSIAPTPGSNTLVINQNQAQAIINWNSFNIGATAAVRFNQGTGTPGTAGWKPDNSFVALNRIYDSSPSLIYGSLSANGSVYLINRNGILFGPNSQVNVHTLVASALDIKDADFTKGLLRFTTDDYTGSGKALGDGAMVANLGNISTDNGGLVALVAPQVVNGGSIATPVGKIALVGAAQAGQGLTDVEISPAALATDPYDVLYDAAARPGSAINTETGSLIADTGRVDMQGATVTQNGVIRAVSSVKLGGAIYLSATDNVTTGATSLTEAPVSDASEKASPTFAYSGGTITIGGIYTTGGTTPLQDLVHNGAIEAPAGTVNLFATDRIYLETGSSISVAGLWVAEPASANLLEAQLNSVQLADSYGQKNGVLQGQNITTTMQNGSSIGNVGNSYTAADQSTQERSTNGGKIVLGDTNNVVSQFIAKQGATLDFSGGGYQYAAGVGPSTTVLAGNTVYDISQAPQNLSYSKVLGDQTSSYAKFGITQEYQGLYLGGGTALNGYLPSRTVGSNAGSLSINARTVVLDSTLNGSVTRGAFQTQTTNPALDNGADYLISVARGLEEPVGGTLSIGSDVHTESGANNLPDFGTGNIAVHAGGTPLPAGFGPGDTLASPQTDLSAALLSSAGLSRLNLYSNGSLTIDAGAKIALLPGGSYLGANGSPVYSSGFSAKALRIVDRGEISVPDGSVELDLSDNASEVAASAIYLPPAARVSSALLIDNGATVSVAGETVDNSLGGGAAFGHINGGAITIEDLTAQGSSTGNPVVVRQGALLDVSGGYTINSAGKVTGGDAGALTLQGATLSVAGELRGLSLAGQKGGSLTLRAGEVDVASLGADLPDNVALDAVPAQFQGKLTLASDRLASTGFTQIELDAIHDLNIASGVTLTPSTLKSAYPVAASVLQGGAGANLGLPADLMLEKGYLGPSSVTLRAGVAFGMPGGGSVGNLDGSAIDPDLNAKLSVPGAAGITVIPGGSITLSGPYLAMNGVLAAPGGNVAVSAGNSDLDIGSSGRILAGGYDQPGTATVAGVPAGSIPQAGGAVTLSSASGSIILEKGSLVDVSGSPAAQLLSTGPDGKPLPVTVAGNAGSLTLSYYNDLGIAGEVDGQARLSGVQGGTLTINNTGGALPVVAAEVQGYLASGFDALTFKSATALNFQGSMELSAGRSITLDAPKITGANEDQIKLAAPWLILTNSSNYLADGQRSASGAKLTLASTGWLDVNGSVLLSGFSDVTAQAAQDIRLNSSNYTLGLPGTVNVHGDLTTAGNLTLQASRIYPATAVAFTLTADGTVTTLPGAANPAPIYSAGGSLTIDAAGGIDHEGFLAAPMGSIALNSPGRVYLADGSVTRTTGDASVYYGTFDGTSWYTNHPSDPGTDPVSAAPAKSISINGNEVIVSPQAKLDAAGGGTVYSYFYQPDTQGTTNPIAVVGTSALTGQVTRPNRYVILPDNSVQLPGFSYTGSDGKQHLASAVYLDGIWLDNGTYLKPGSYALLPEQYAFLPGALVISDLGQPMAPGLNPRTSEGYQVVGGYATVLGTAISSQLTEGYSVRSAASVLNEGNFTVKQAVAGDAGSLTITGNSTIMAAALNVGALAGYQQGSLTLSGKEISVQETVADLPPGFDFGTPLPDSFAGQLQIAASTLSGTGLGTLQLGDSNTTSSLTVKRGSLLNIPSITLVAADALTVESGAQVNGISSSGGGTVTLSAPTGTIDLQAGAQVHASNGVTLNAGDVNLQGALTADHGFLNLASGEIFFVSDSYTKDAKGLYLTETFRNSFANYDQVTLTSGSDLNFLSDVSLSLKNTALTLDAGRFTGPATVSVDAKSIGLLNSGSAAPDPDPTQPLMAGSSLTLTSEAGIQAHGAVVFNGFQTVNLTSANDLTLQGAGSLQTAGDLNLTAARVTTSYFRDASNTYHAADFTINALGAVSIANSGAAQGSTTTPGGTLAISGAAISQSGIIEVASGQVLLTAGSGGISLAEGAQILARGTRQATAGTATTGAYDYTPGGQISLASAGGSVSLGNGSTLDVSAAQQGDAGTISLAAPSGTVTLSGTLNGKAGAGTGGSFTLDTNGPALDLNALNSALQSGGFTGQLDIRARQGDLTLAQGQTMSAGGIVLEADGTDGKGNIGVNGTITALSDAGGTGGRVELDAQNDLSVDGAIGAAAAQLPGSAASGGSVYLNSESGMLALQNGVIDVSGAPAGKGGEVYLRAAQNAGSGMNLALGGQLKGASSVVAEAFQVYHKTGSITASDTTTWMSDANAYLGKAWSIESDAAWDPATFHLRPGIEVRSSGDLTLATAWDLSSARFGGEPGVLTLRAAGNLNLDANLVDHPTGSPTALNSATMKPSWGINLAAGADLSAATPLAVNAAGTGDLTIASGKVVYSEDAPIRFASGHDTVINKGAQPGYMLTTGSNSMAYSLASYGGEVEGTVGHDLVFQGGGAIQTATGAIAITVGGDLDLYDGTTLGAIRTTGEYAGFVSGTTKDLAYPGPVVYTTFGTPAPIAQIQTAKITDYWNYSGGGAIALDVNGRVNGTVLTLTNTTPGQSDDWDMLAGGKAGTDKYLTANYSGVNATAGIATMAGGDVTVRAGGDFKSQIGLFGSGDLSLFSGGDISGRYRLTDGKAAVTGMGNFGDQDALDLAGRQVVELANARFDVSVQGDAFIGALLNPSNTRIGVFNLPANSWNLSYTPTTEASFHSLSGTISMDGSDQFDGYDAPNSRNQLLPAAFSLAASGDVLLQNSFYMVPSPSGDLQLFAGGSINGSYLDSSNEDFAGIIMTDKAPASFYGYHTAASAGSSGAAADAVPAIDGADNSWEKTLVHQDALSAPVQVVAGADILNLQLDLPERAEIGAGRDIVNLVYLGQNVNTGDLSSISAGRDISYTLRNGTLGGVQILNLPLNVGILEGGAGTLLVQAGRNIDLGLSQGIQSIGNVDNSLFSSGTGCDLIVAAGAKQVLNVTEAEAFFNGVDGVTDHADQSQDGIRQAGIDYSNLKAMGDAAAAQQRIDQARSGIIGQLFDAPAGDGSGTLTMTQSQISSTNGKGDIYILARGDLGVGTSALSSNVNVGTSGIYSAGGGAINIYSGGDTNVNQSRVMSFLGGDITVWSDQGNINAGRGSRTAVSPGKENPVVNSQGKTVGYTYQPPAVGSGIRAVTSDPNTVPGGPLPTPEPGNIYLFAPKGAIDAGEAGIAGGKVILGATTVLNAQNISFSAGSVGVPSSSESNVSMGALSGAGSVTENSKMIEQSSSLGSGRDQATQQVAAVDDFMSQWLDLRIVSFDGDDSPVGDEDGKARKK